MAFADLFKKKKDPKSPTKAGDEGGATINNDIIPFLNIIAKNSLALPGMARDMNVLRQNIVKLVKLKNAEAITKADKFFKTEDQREAELEEAKKKETTPVPVDKEGKPKKEKEEGGKGEEGVFEYLWNLLKKILGTLFLGITLALASAFDFGKIFDSIKEALNPLPLIEKFFDSIASAWKEITETDIVKETLIKGIGKFLEFITAGLFGEKELRQSLSDLQEFISPMIDVITETFGKIVNWLKDNIGWDPFTIPLSKINDLPLVGDALKKFGFGFSDIEVPGFRPFKDKKEPEAPKGSMTPAAPAAAPKETAKQEEVQYDPMTGLPIGGAPESAAPTKQPTKRKVEGKTERASANVAKEAEKDKKSAVEFLKNKVGIVYDPNSPTMFSDLRSGNFVEEQSVRDRIVDMKGNPDKILSLVKPTPTAAPATTAQQTGSTSTPAAGATDTSKPPSGGSVQAPSPETTPAPAASGAAISSASSDVAEGQRMDSAADAGTYIDAGTTNTTTGTSGKKAKQTADAYNTSFINNYYGKTATA